MYRYLNFNLIVEVVYFNVILFDVNCFYIEVFVFFMNKILNLILFLFICSSY